MGDNKDSTGLILLGILIGVIAFAILSRRTYTLSSQSTVQQPTSKQHQHHQYLDWQPMDIPRVDDIKLQTVPQPIQPVQIVKTDPQLVQMASQLEKTASQLEQATSKLQDTMSRLQQLRQNSPPSQIQPIIIQPTPIYQQNQPPQHQSTPIYQQNQPPQINVQPVQEHLKQDQPTHTNIQIQKPEVVQSPQIVQPIQPPQIAQPIQEQQIYKNSEKWQIVRGKDGRIKFLDIVRNVKKSD